MSPSSYGGYPFRPLGERLQQLIDHGASPEKARSRLNTELAIGTLELKHPLPFRRLQLRSRGQLDIETTDGRLIPATDIEARYRPIPTKPGILGPTVPMSDATRKLFEARIRQLGGGYVVSASGSGFVLPTVSEPVEKNNHVPTEIARKAQAKKKPLRKSVAGAKESKLWGEIILPYLKEKFPGKPYPKSSVSFNAVKDCLLDNKKNLLAESTIRAGLRRHFPKWPRNSRRR